ncbi:Os05g0562350, partial [Oryza sativa Japonica Group]
RERDLPTGVSDFPGNLHLLGGAFVELLQAARQLPLDRRRLQRPPGATAVHPVVPVGAAAERRAEDVVPEDRRREPRAACPHPGPSPHAAAHATAHAAERAGRAEELREDVLRVARVEPEHVGPVAAGGEERRASRAGPAGARRRDLPLEPLLAVLVVHRSLLRVAQHLRRHPAQAQTQTPWKRHVIAQFSKKTNPLRNRSLSGCLPRTPRRSA